MEWHVTENGKYRIESLSAATFPGALKIIQEVFAKEESVSIGSGLNEDPLAVEELVEFFVEPVLHGVSLVAVEVATGEVASVAINKLLDRSSNPEDDDFFEKLAEGCTREASQSLLNFVAVTSNRCNVLKVCGVDCSLEILALATHHGHIKQGLGVELCKTSIELARKLKDGPVSTFTVEDLGPDFSHMKPKKPLINTYPKICEAMWTGEASQKIGKKLNFEVYWTIPYDEFIYDGQTYSDRIGMEKLIENPFAEVAALRLYKK